MPQSYVWFVCFSFVCFCPVCLLFWFPCLFTWFFIDWLSWKPVARFFDWYGFAYFEQTFEFTKISIFCWALESWWFSLFFSGCFNSMFRKPCQRKLRQNNFRWCCLLINVIVEWFTVYIWSLTDHKCATCQHTKLIHCSQHALKHE